LQPWAPAKFYRLRRGFGPGGSTVAQGATLTFDVGEYDPLLGESYSEIATVSRSQHRMTAEGYDLLSQAFGFARHCESTESRP